MDVSLLFLPLWLQTARWEAEGSASAGNGILSTLPPLQPIWAQLAVLECTRYHANPAPREARHATASQIKHTHNAETCTLKTQVLPWPNPPSESWHWSNHAGLQERKKERKKNDYCTLSLFSTAFHMCLLIIFIQSACRTGSSVQLLKWPFKLKHALQHIRDEVQCLRLIIRKGV